MLWEEDDKVKGNEVGEVVDLIFSISCKTLPSDHAYILSMALQEVLPWLATEALAGMHMIHIMESGHGWSRPTDEDALLLLSRRTKFILRLPKHRVEDAKQLTGKTLEIKGHPITFNDSSIRELSELTTVISRYVVTDEKDEQVFTEKLIAELESMGVYPKKLLCGVEKNMIINNKKVSTRSVMLAEISQAETLLLQQKGVGPHRKFGCGLFVPQKDIADLN